MKMATGFGCFIFRAAPKTSGAFSCEIEKILTGLFELAARLRTPRNTVDSFWLLQ
jgi:hypothetical protein